MTTLVCNFSDVLGTPVPNGIARVTSGEVRPGLLADTVIVPRMREQPLVDGSAVFPQVEPGDIVIHLVWGDQSASIRTLVPDQETVNLSDCIQYDLTIPSDIETARALAKAARESQDKARQYAEEAASAVTTAAAGAVDEVKESVAADKALIEGYKNEASGFVTSAQQAAATAAADAVAEASNAISTSVQRAETAAGEAEASAAKVDEAVANAAGVVVAAVQEELDEELAQAEAAATRAAEHEAGAAAAAAAEVNKLKGEAPEAFDTLGEIAAELAANDTERAALASLIAGKADKAHTHTVGEVTGLEEALASAGTAEHTHTQSDVEGLVDALAGKASTDHTHTAADVGAAPESHSHTAAQISDATTVGRNVLKASSQAAARTAIGAGTSNLELGTTSSTAAAGNHTHSQYATTTQVNARTPEIRIVSSPELATSPGVLYVVGEA